MLSDEKAMKYAEEIRAAAVAFNKITRMAAEQGLVTALEISEAKRYPEIHVMVSKKLIDLGA